MILVRFGFSAGRAFFDDLLRAITSFVRACPTGARVSAATGRGLPERRSGNSELKPVCFDDNHVAAT
jgi:hypothetical protein